MNDVLVNVSYCQAHRKRPRDERLGGVLHARWLGQCVGHLLAGGFTVSVSVTCWKGWGAVGHDERLVLEDIEGAVPFLTAPEMGHQEGAARNIAQGLEFAVQSRCPFMIHTAEDVAVSHGALRQIADLLREGNVYAGSAWDGVVHGREVRGLNSQFFGCNVGWFGMLFDPNRLGAGTLEELVRQTVADGDTHLFPVEGPAGHETHGPYEHSHDHDEWLTMMRRAGANL